MVQRICQNVKKAPLRNIKQSLNLFVSISRTHEDKNMKVNNKPGNSKEEASFSGSDYLP